MRHTFFTGLSKSALLSLCFASAAFYSIARPFVGADEVNAQENNSLSVSVGPENILDNKEPLPVNDRILSLLSLVQQKSTTNTAKVEDVLLQLEDINSSFNAAEKYLIFFIHGLIEHYSNNDKQAIIWLEKTLVLRDEIPEKQLYLPEFSEVNLILAKSFSARL
jgi:hypothetical protein